MSPETLLQGRSVIPSRGLLSRAGAIAIPVDSPQREQARVSRYFAGVACFARYDGRGVWQHTLRNQARGSGQQLRRCLAEAGVSEVVFRQLGDKLYGWLRPAGSRAFALAGPDTSLDDALRALRQRRLEPADDATLGCLLHPAGPANRQHCEPHD